MRYIKGKNRKQNLLFPESFDEYIDKDSPARMFEAFEESLDFKELEELEKRFRSGKKGGRPCFEMNFLGSTTESL